MKASIVFDKLNLKIWKSLWTTACCGAQVRKLEFLMAQALQDGADTVVTLGGIQSNHARATAVAARCFPLSKAV